MSQRSIALSLIALLAGAAAGAALMAGLDAPRPQPVATTALVVPSTPAWRGMPESYPVIPGATEADVNPRESSDALGNLGDGP